MSNKNKAWLQYEAGKEYKRRIGLYEKVKQNERFYRGEQWSLSEGSQLPKPVFNIIKRVADYLICSVASANLKIKFSDEYLPYLREEREKEAIQKGLELLQENAAYRWERSAMDSKVLRLITDAAISGDGVLYCYWEPDLKSPQPYNGDIVTDVIDNVNLFVSDVNKPDIQSQDYIILSGRASVASLRAEAELWGVSKEDIEKIVPDEEYGSQSGDYASYELKGDGESKATYIIKFMKVDGKVVFEKSTRDCIIKRAKTECRLYPVAYFNWMPTKNCFHGTSPITPLIANQKFINRAYAMAMKHMTDTAFSKVIYDKNRIPEWTNEVGEAIAAVGGGSIADAVSVVGVGEMQNGYMELIESSVSLTKELMGATESALGSEEATNTSAILALQETSRIPLEQIRNNYYRAVEDLASIWADMMCAYYPNDRLVPYYKDGTPTTDFIDINALKRGFINAKVDVLEVSRFTAASIQNMLDKLLDGGHITPDEYVKRIPSGMILNRTELIENIQKRNRKEVNDATYG